MYIKHFLPAISLIALSFSIPTIPTWAENSSLKTGIDVKEPQKIKVDDAHVGGSHGGKKLHRLDPQPALV